MTQKFGKLDILINNAGIARSEGGDWGTSTASIISQEILKEIYETNFFGLVAVTQTFLPLLKKSAAARIVNVGSMLGSLTMHADFEGPLKGFKTFGYNSSKTAVNAFTIHLAAELRETPHKVNTAHPGWVKTDLGTDAATHAVAVREKDALVDVSVTVVDEHFVDLVGAGLVVGL